MPWRTLTGFVAAVAAIVIAVAAYFLVAADRNRRAVDVSDRSEGGVDARATEGLAGAQRDLRSGDGGWLTETVEAVRAELEAIEGAALREHRRAWFERVALADAIFLGANVLLLALVVAAGLAARAELRRREERAQERLRLLELQERILGIVSHDLRKPARPPSGRARRSCPGAASRPGRRASPR